MSRIPVARVAVPTAAFWVAKALSTAMGESVSDWSTRAAPPVLAVLVGLAAFAVALGVQLTRDRYQPWAYWVAVAMVGVFGTMAADVAHVALGLPYAVSFLVCAALLGGLFVVWRRTEGTCDVHAVTTTRRELLYWAAVVLTFAMGTALGDLTAVTLHLGYGSSIALFAALVVVPVVGHRLLQGNGVASFWFAYVLTRPLGASVADWLGKPVAARGVGLGSGWVGLTLAVLMAAVVATTAGAHRRGGRDTGDGGGGAHDTAGVVSGAVPGAGSGVRRG